MLVFLLPVLQTESLNNSSGEKMHSILLKKIIFYLIFTFNLVFAQTTYYVSETGNDDNDGLASSTAFATLQQAADVVSAGDSVLVLSGNYSGFDLRESGTQNSPIVFNAIENDVVIDQQNSVTPDGINIENAAWIIIDGFEVKDQPRAGIRAAVSDFVTIRNNYCHNNYRWGIFTGFTDDITIENNVCSYSQDEHGIYVSNSGDRPIVRNNTCFENNGCGIQLNADLSQGGDGIITDAVIESNILHDNCYGGGSAINLDGVQESEIYNNLLYNNHSTGIALFMIDGAEGSKNNKVYNNTIINPSDGRWNILVVDGSTGNTLYNNILINNHSFRGSIAVDAESFTGFTSDYNLLEDRLSSDGDNTVISLSSWQNLGYDLHSSIVDSEENIFINYLSEDFHLTENSQATNAGTSLVSGVVSDDLDDITRPQDNDYDIGCYEFTGTTVVSDENHPDEFRLFQNYPNPFNPTTKIKYTIPAVVTHRAVSVLLKVYDILGNEITTLVNEDKSAGSYEVEFNAGNLPSGIYFYRLEAGMNISIKKLILLK